MPDVVTSQAYDGARNYQIKLTSVSDGTGETLVKKVDHTTLVPDPGTHMKLKCVRYSIENMAAVRLVWEGTPNQDLLLISSGESELDFSDDFAGGIPNNATTPTGNVLLSTIGAMPNSNYTIFLEFVKGVQLI